MTKTLKKILYVVFGAFAFLCAGFFFTGCGVDYDSIYISSEEQSIELEIGQSQEVIFNISNYQKGFDNRINVSERTTAGQSAGATAVFTCSNVTYLSNSRMKVTITAVAGGEAILYARTLEAGKECSVDVKVIQHSESLAITDDVLYVTDKTPLEPSSALFEFDSHTTDKEMSYFYLNRSGYFAEQNIKDYKLKSVNRQTNIAQFETKNGRIDEAEVYAFDSVNLDMQSSKVVFKKDAVVSKEISFISNFEFLAVYNYSEVNYDEILYAVSDIYVLPSLDLKVYGGYLIDEKVTFSEIESGKEIVVVPNNTKMHDYIIKLEIVNAMANAPISIKSASDNDVYLDIVNFAHEESGLAENVQVEYWKVSQKSYAQGQTRFDFQIYYDIAQDAEDDDVNTKVEFVGKIEVAPTNLTINGTSEPPTLGLYNAYIGNFGWKDLYVGVGATYGISPSYDGVYFTYDTSKIDLICGGVLVSSGDSRLYKDLSKPFKIKGKDGAIQGETQVVVHLKSDILQEGDELTLAQNCIISEGANVLSWSGAYQGYRNFYLDIDGGRQDFFDVLYADRPFQAVSVEFIGGSNVATLVPDEDPYIKVGETYYLNMSVTPKAVGVGYYRVYLDNGRNQEIAFNVVRTLQPETTSIRLADTGNGSVTYFAYERSVRDGVTADFDDIINIEIINPSSKDKTTFGSFANLVVSANVSTNGVSAVSDNDTIDIVGSKMNYKLVTTKNGEAQIVFTLTGYQIETTEFEKSIFAVSPRVLTMTINVVSYSLVSEFYVKNGESYANLNYVYYGEGAGVDEKTIDFELVANSADASYFYRYGLTQDVIAEMFANASGASGSSFSIAEADCEQALVNETLDRKFVYFYAQTKSGGTNNVFTDVTITKTLDGESQSKTITLKFANGLMFNGKDFSFEVKDAGKTITYDVEFSNQYRIGYRGESFDVKTLTYAIGNGGGGEDTIHEGDITRINAVVSQRGFSQKYSRNYTMTIMPQEFKAIEYISLASGLSKLNFTSSKLSYTLGVYTFPVSSTNKSIRVEFVKSAENNYSNLINYSVGVSDSDSGVYMVTISCESFYDLHQEEIENITCPLTGTIYIYPSEWGKSYTSLKKKTPLTIAVQYRNGSKANPYLIENADDVLAIGSNETMLRSNYEINSVIDMSGVRNIKPIGILNDEIVGFSGTIIGSSSQASITNVNVVYDKDNLEGYNFAAKVGSVVYGGLFVQTNGGIVGTGSQYKGAKIENLKISGSFDIKSNVETSAGLLVAENHGMLINVGASVSTSNVRTTGNELNIGGLAGRNFGYIYQDFKKYNGEKQAGSESGTYVAGYDFKKLSGSIEEIDGRKYIVVDDVPFWVDDDNYVLYQSGNRAIYDGEELLPEMWVYTGQKSKNLAYFEGRLNITGEKTAGKKTTINAGGVIGKNLGEIRKFGVCGLYGYGAYSAFTLIDVVGSADEVSLGGAIGRNVGSDKNIYVTDLLVGGELNTKELTADSKDYIGGILGYTTEGSDTCAIAIKSNTARVFVRGIHNVGGIAGYEYYTTEDNYLVDWGTENKVEAIDDGRSAFESALIIKYTQDSSTELTGFIAIGNEDNRRVYTSERFNLLSYLDREQIIGAERVDRNNVSTTNYYGDYISFDSNPESADYLKFYAKPFEKKSVDLSNISGDNTLTTTAAGAAGQKVFFMYYFGIDGMLSGEQGQAALQEDINALNVFAPTDRDFYPFKSESTDILISVGKSSIMSIDAGGFISVRGVGLVVLTLDSILNVNFSQKIYVYVVGYFDKNVDHSLYYASPSPNSVMMTDNSLLYIYGKSNTNLYVVPSYKLEKTETSDGEEYEISEQGALLFKNVRYVLSKNSFISTDVDFEGTPAVSDVQINKQTIVFRRKAGAMEDVVDNYSLAPIMKVNISIDGQTYEFYYEFDDETKISLDVLYKNTATLINPHYNYHSIQTNNGFTDFAMVESTNTDEKLFYQIYKIDEDGNTLVQNKTPLTMAGILDYNDYINDIENGLFDVHITKRSSEINVFDYTFKINKDSEAFKKRFEQNIYGEYLVVLYANELADGISGQFVIKLEEAVVNYVSLINHSNIADVSISDEIVVPSQNGLLEISVDPVEAVFDSISISNSAANYRAGAGEIRFTFVYLKNGEFVPSYTFETNVDGAMSFTYKAMKDFLTNVGVEYNGKIYIRYFMPAYNVEDGVSVGFDVRVNYAMTETHETSIPLITKLSSFAKLSFVDRDSSGQVKVARGLSYQLKLDYYGFTEDQITISSSQEAFAYVSKVNGKYVLNISAAQITNNENRRILIGTHAEKIVDDNRIFTDSTLEIYVMEYVFDYEYVAGGKFEDIVKGMRNGIINDAIGNPYKLEMEIEKFVEYDKSITEVVGEVNAFVTALTGGVEWNVYLDKTPTKLESGKIIKSQYYVISSYTVTPLQIYNAKSNVYYFSAKVNYAENNGIYIRDDDSTIMLYTEFSFDVHDQSTEDSPIPVNSYEDFIDMQDGEWYILTKDIVIPDAETAQAQGLENFSPITANLKGLDGNGRKIILSGRYTFDEANVGIFSSVAEGMVLKNIDISLATDVVFAMTSLSYDVGILAASNFGVITNCNVSSQNGSVVSAVFGGDTSAVRDKTGSYVAGLVATNSGFITHSRVSANIKTDVNLSGVVAQNTGHIASTYYMGATLENSAIFEFTAGFVISNVGVIYTSYVSGDPSESESVMYYDGQRNAIKSSGNIAGFVYDNSGSIFDSYSNISLKSESGAYSTGFVYVNTGKIERCFSTSQLTKNATSSYGFIRFTSQNNTTGVLQNCFFLQDGGINTSIEEVRGLEEGELKALSIAEFGKFGANFEDYLYHDEGDINSIWVIRTFGSGESKQQRLELVAANIIAKSVRDLDRVEQIRDEETGAAYAKYIYIYREGTNPLGSQYNPIVIYDYETMENYILAENNAAGYNYAHYRIVCDIDYGEMTSHSELYKTRFMGYLEANFVEISGITLLTDESLTYAGLFAEVGSSVDDRAIGTLMNFTFKPETIGFLNAQVVGSLAGKIDGATILNVNVVTENGQKVVLGGNIVGGAIGLALGDYEIINLYSNLGAKAFYLPSTAENVFDGTIGNFGMFSFAGAFAGVLSGTGYVKNVSLNDDDEISVFGNRAGLFFGLVDEGVSIENVNVEITDNMLISSSGYGGFVVGESRGEINNISVLSGLARFTNFRRIPNMPTAIGGVAGLMKGGKFTNVEMRQSISVASESADIGVEAVGGIAGRVSKAVEIQNVVVEADFVAFRYVGGIFGLVDEKAGIIDIKDISVTTSLTAGGRSVGVLGIGGVVGFLNKENSLNLRTTKYVSTTDSSIKAGKTYYTYDDENERYSAVASPVGENIESYYEVVKNKVSINNVKTSLYSYGEGGNVYVGAILGMNASLDIQNVYNTDAYVKAGDIRVYEMSQPNNPTTASVKAGQTLGEGVARVVAFTTYAATDSETSFAVNFTYPTFIDTTTDTSPYGMKVSLFGLVKNA